jgi:hypothetical protein
MNSSFWPTYERRATSHEFFKKKQAHDLSSLWPTYVAVIIMHSICPTGQSEGSPVCPKYQPKWGIDQEFNCNTNNTLDKWPILPVATDKTSVN